MSEPTTFPELNARLEELVVRVAAILGENFVGGYLQGSFAIGDADIHSDCDFIVVTEETVTHEQEQALRELHDEIPSREDHWTHHLEGSYAPRAEIETLDGLCKDWLYIDHGWREMQWGTHCRCMSAARTGSRSTWPTSSSSSGCCCSSARWRLPAPDRGMRVRVVSTEELGTSNCGEGVLYAPQYRCSRCNHDRRALPGGQCAGGRG